MPCNEFAPPLQYGAVDRFVEAGRVLLFSDRLVKTLVWRHEPFPPEGVTLMAAVLGRCDCVLDSGSLGKGGVCALLRLSWQPSHFFSPSYVSYHFYSWIRFVYLLFYSPPRLPLLLGYLCASGLSEQLCKRTHECPVVVANYLKCRQLKASITIWSWITGSSSAHLENRGFRGALSNDG